MKTAASAQHRCETNGGTWGVSARHTPAVTPLTIPPTLTLFGETPARAHRPARFRKNGLSRAAIGRRSPTAYPPDDGSVMCPFSLAALIRRRHGISDHRSRIPNIDALPVTREATIN